MWVSCVTWTALESILAQATIAYLERRYLALEKEIENALHDSPIDDFAVADLKCRKLIIADEIQHNRRLVDIQQAQRSLSTTPF
jgi:hypothetical protein